MVLSRCGGSVAVCAGACVCRALLPSKQGLSAVNPQAWGTMPDGALVSVYTLKNDHGMEARITTYGGAVVSLTAPDRNGKWADVVLGMDSLAGYRSQANFFGALIGRY